MSMINKAQASQRHARTGESHRPPSNAVKGKVSESKSQTPCPWPLESGYVIISFPVMSPFL
jgi:hypothetical protein